MSERQRRFARNVSVRVFTLIGFAFVTAIAAYALAVPGDLVTWSFWLFCFAVVLAVSGVEGSAKRFLE